MAIRATGKVERIFPDTKGCFVKLENIPADVTPKDDYFRLKLDHVNYNALYSLLIVAAINRYTLTIRTEKDINPNEHAMVNYLVVEW